MGRVSHGYFFNHYLAYSPLVRQIGILGKHMSTGLKIWRKVTGVFGWLNAKREKKLLQQSSTNPIVRIYFRDSFRYYENGRWIMVSGELMSRSSEIERLIYRKSPLKWNDTGALLTPEEAEKVFQKVGEHLDKNKIRWKYSDARTDN